MKFGDLEVPPFVEAPILKQAIDMPLPCHWHQKPFQDAPWNGTQIPVPGHGACPGWLHKFTTKFPANAYHIQPIVGSWQFPVYDVESIAHTHTDIHTLRYVTLRYVTYIYIYISDPGSNPWHTPMIFPLPIPPWDPQTTSPLYVYNPLPPILTSFPQFKTPQVALLLGVLNIVYY